MHRDRRQTSRIFFDKPAELTVDDKNFYVRQIENLSVGGCLLDIKDNFTVGAACNLKILVDGTHLGMIVDTIGKVAHNRNDAVGVEFTYVLCIYLIRWMVRASVSGESTGTLWKAPATTRGWFMDVSQYIFTFPLLQILLRFTVYGTDYYGQLFFPKLAAKSSKPSPPESKMYS